MTHSRQTSLFSEADLPPNPLAWEVAAEADRLLAEVVFNRPLTTVYHYLVPNELRELIGPGRRVQVPFGRGNQSINGFCVGLSTQIPTGKALKTVTAVLDREPLIDARMLELTHWIAGRYLCGWGQVLESIIPAGVKSKAGTREVTFFGLAPDLVTRLALVPSPPSSGERARVRGPSGDEAPSNSNNSTLPPSPRRGGPGRGDDARGAATTQSTPLPNPPPQGEGIGQKKASRAAKAVTATEAPLTLTLSSQSRGEGTRKTLVRLRPPINDRTPSITVPARREPRPPFSDRLPEIPAAEVRSIGKK